MLSASLLRRVHFRGKARLLHSLCPHAGIRYATLFGFGTELDLSKYIERCMYLHIFEPTESKLVRGYLKPGMVVVDAGANVGYYTLMSSAKVGPKGRVFAFEPSPYAINKLKKTIAENRIQNATLIEAALGDSEGRSELYVPQYDCGNHTPSMVVQDFPPTPIEIRTLDSFLQERDIQRVDLLKLDVEGFEPNIIRGAQRTLVEGRIKAVLCEFNEHWLTRNHSSSQQLFDLVSTFGFLPKDCQFDPTLPLQNLLMTTSS